MAKSFYFAHLLRHARANRADVLVRMRQYQKDPSELRLVRLAASLGSLECLYWQALGCDEVLLAKKIARTLFSLNQLACGQASELIRQLGWSMADYQPPEPTPV